MLGAFSSTREFHHFVLAGNEASLRRFYTQGRRSPILGGERFRAWVRRKVQAGDREHPRYQRRSVLPPEGVVVVAVAQSYGVPVSTVEQGRRGRENEPRRVAMYLVHRLCDLTLRETAERFGVGSYGAVGWACSKVAHRLRQAKEFRVRVERIVARISQQKT